MSDEILQVYQALWTQDRPQFHGTYYDFPPMRFLPKPMQRPYPPIWIGGRGRTTSLAQQVGTPARFAREVRPLVG